jgi:hypothetical protein
MVSFNFVVAEQFTKNTTFFSSQISTHSSQIHALCFTTCLYVFESSIVL